MEQHLEKISKLMEEFKTDSAKQLNGNKAAGTRARKTSLEIAKELKAFRGLSVAL